MDLDTITTTTQTEAPTEIIHTARGKPSIDSFLEEQTRFINSSSYNSSSYLITLATYDSDIDPFNLTSHNQTPSKSATITHNGPLENIEETIYFKTETNFERPNGESSFMKAEEVSNGTSYHLASATLANELNNFATATNKNLISKYFIGRYDDDTFFLIERNSEETYLSTTFLESDGNAIDMKSLQDSGTTLRGNHQNLYLAISRLIDPPPGYQ